MMNRNFFKSGFTLLELSIVLVIMGVLLIPALNFLAVSQKASKVIEVRKDLKIISHALSSYYKTYQKLPAPALPHLNITDDDSGTAAKEPYANMVDSKTDFDPVVTDTILYGAVPVETIGLSYKYLTDAWGNKYSYYVRLNAVDDTPGPITMNSTTDIYTHDVNIGRDDDGTTFVIISHGEDGRGAYPKAGGSANSSADANPSEDNNIYIKDDMIIANTAEQRLMISDGGIGDISISSTGADVVNEVVGHNAGGDYFAGNFRIMGGTGHVGIGSTNPYTDLQFSESHYSPASADRILNWYGEGATEIHNNNISIAVGNNNSSTVQPRSIGLSLFNNNRSENIWSPAITFGGLSVNGDFMNGSAAISSQISSHTDEDFREGDLVFFTKNDNLLTEKMRIHENGQIDFRPDTGVVSHFAYGTNKDWYIRSGDDAGKVIIQDTGGNVGIGTATPGEKLEVRGNFRIDPTMDTKKAAKIYMEGSDGTFINFKEKGSNDTFSIYNDFSGTGNNNRFMILSSSTNAAPAERDAKLTIEQGGDVGIGTNTPSEKLDVNGNIKTDFALIANRTQNGGGPVFLHKDLSATSDFALFQSSYGNTFLNSKFGQSLWFTNNGDTGNPLMEITSSGVIRAYYLGSGDVQASNGVLSVSSDKRMKKNIEEYRKGQERLKHIKAFSYNWKDSKKNKGNGRKYLGFIAQNVEKFIPEAVTEGENGYLGLDSRAILATSVNAIKELVEENKQLNKRILLLEEKIEHLMKANNQ